MMADLSGLFPATVFSGVMLLRPFWLLAVPLVVMAGVAIHRREVLAESWTEAVEPRLMAAMAALGWVVERDTGGRSGRTGLRRLSARLVPLFLLALIAVALSGPARQTVDGATFRNLDGVVLVMDLSHSVTDEGLGETLSAARIVASAAGARPVALVVYGGDAYVASGFTTDAEVLGTTIAVLDGETVPDDGARTNPAKALKLARSVLTEAGLVSGDVVMVSAGEGTGSGTLAEARALSSGGFHLSTLATLKAEHGALSALANAGDGLAATVVDPLKLAEVLGARSTTNVLGGALTALIWTDYGRYLLVLAMVPGLLLFRRQA